MQRRSSFRRFSACALAAVLSVAFTGALTPTAHASTFTWAGGGGASNGWSNASNWDPDAVPSSGDSVIFAGSTLISQVTSLLDAAYSLNSVTFNTGSSAKAFTVTAGGADNVLSIGAGGITNNTALTQTIDAPVSLTAATTINAATAAGTLYFTGTSSNANNGISMAGNALTFTGPGNITIDSPLTNTGSAGNLTMNGTGTLTLTSSANSLGNSNPNIYLNNGTTLLQGANGSSYASLNSGYGNLYVGTGSGNNGTLTVAGTNGSGSRSSFTNLEVIYIGGSGTGTVNITGGGLINSYSQVFIGASADSIGTLNVAGTSSDGALPSTFDALNTITLGGGSGGVLSITGGGYATALSIFLNQNAMLTVSGTNGLGTASTLSLYSEVYMGASPNDTFNITDGGKAYMSRLFFYSNYASTLNINGGSLYISQGFDGSTTNVTYLLTNPSLANGGGYALNTSIASNQTIYPSIGDAAGGPGGIDMTGTGSLTLNNANTFSGGVQIDNGSVILGNALSIQNSTAIINVNNGLNLNGLPSATIGGLAGSGSLSLGSTALTVGGNNASTTYIGALSGSGSFIKTGTGTLSLSGGASTYSGGTSINAGTVVGTGGTITGTTLTNGALGTGTVTVSSGATLAVGQSVDTKVGTAVSSYKQLDIASLTLTGNSVTGSATPLLTFDLGPAGSSDGSTNDFLKISGSANSLMFSGAGTYYIGFASGSGASISSPQSYELISFATPVALASATISNPNAYLTAEATGNLGAINAGAFSWIVSDGNIVGLQFNMTGAGAVPEPPAGLLALVVAAPAVGVGALRRRVISAS